MNGSETLNEEREAGLDYESEKQICNKMCESDKQSD